MSGLGVIFSASLISAFFVLIFLILFLLLFWKVLKRIIINSVVGIIALLLLHYVFKIQIPITIATLLVTGLFGLAGVGAMLILRIAGLM
ncbi:pro-sigmaK processing inhibitor BofA family protein [Candidatus Altiarchaeota archaeon]